MRVIAGTARSLRLKTPEGSDTRPTTDRIKETLFNMIHQNLPGTTFLDLFAGSGGIGIEALSRGAHAVVFVDSGKDAVRCIQDNITHTKFEHQSKVYHKDSNTALYQMSGKEKFDFVFMDPPYHTDLEKEALTALIRYDLLADDAIVIVESALDTDISFAEELGYICMKEKCYKTNKHTFLQKRKEQNV